VWYRIKLDDNCSHAQGQPPQLAMLAHWVTQAGEIFVGEQLLWRDRNLVEPLSRSWNSPRYWILPGPDASGVRPPIWIRVAGASGQKSGLGPLHFGTPEAMHDLHSRLVWQNRTSLQLNMMVCAALSLLFLCIWWWRRSNAPAFWYALQAMTWALFCATTLSTETWPFASTDQQVRGVHLLAMVHVATFSLFAWRFAGRRLPRGERVLWITLGTATLATVLLPAARLQPFIAISGLLTVVLFVLVCVQLIVWSLQRKAGTELRIFAMCQPVFIAAAIHDVTKLQGQVLHGSPSLMPYAGIASALAMSWLMGRRLALDVRRIERFGEEQHAAVTRACAELETALGQEHALKLGNSRLQERLRFIHDLHDSLGGQISRSIMHAEREGLQYTHPGTLSSLKLLRDDLRQLIDGGNTTHAPRSPAEWVAPLRHRFGMLFDEMEINLGWKLPRGWGQCPPHAHCLAMARLIEEALTNIVKHSRASNAWVEVHQDEDASVHVHVHDDGTGFDPELVRLAGQGVGMQSMHERMHRLGGRLEVTSTAGSTRLRACLPAG
jgi:two-component system sensor histidine kinase UhpB